MNKKQGIKNFISHIFNRMLLVTIALLMPCSLFVENKIYAAGQTYYESCFNYLYYPSNDHTTTLTVDDVNTRVIFDTGNYGHLRMNLISDTDPNSNFQYHIESNSSCPVNVSSWNNLAVSQYYYDENNNRYYIGRYDLGNVSSNAELLINKFDSSLTPEQLYDYSFGNLAVGNEPQINYGSLKTGYSTSFAGSGGGDYATSGYNKDIITWDNYDTNGNLLQTGNTWIQIRAVPGYYSADNKADLLLETYLNWVNGVLLSISNGNIGVVEGIDYYDLVTISPSAKQYEVTWNQVYQAFGNNWNENSTIAQLVNNKWYSLGWRYEIRYIIGDTTNPDYESPWQIIYQVTSVNPSTKEGIYENYNNLSPELYNLLQTVNTLNNTVQNWNTNGIPIDMQTHEPLDNGNTWVDVLLEGLLDLVNTIAKGISDVIQAILGFGSDIISGLFDLIQNLGINVLQFFRDIFNDIQEYTDSINLELPKYEISEEVINGLNEFKTLGNEYLNIYFNSGLGLVVLIPLIILLLRVII